MKDNLGNYYYPYPGNPRVRVYVQKNEEGICFRLWNKDQPDLWAEHGWVPHKAILAAQGIYKGQFDTATVYDLNVAKALLTDD